MTPLEKFKILKIDKKILLLHGQNHTKRKYVRENILTKEFLTYLIETENYSANYIATVICKSKGYDVEAGSIINIANSYGIKTKTIKEVSSSPKTRELYKKTCLKKYGTINSLSKGTKSYKKRNRTVKSKYGVSNVFQLQTVIDKSKKTLFDRYGVNAPCEMPSYERNNGRRSKLQMKIEQILIDKNIKFKVEVAKIFNKFNKKLNKFYSPIVDILIENKKIVLEVYGDKWHGNPEIYRSSDMINKWGGLVSASEIWKHDKIRKKHIESFGYKVIELWQKDIKTNMTKIRKIINKIK